jgi:hypothetical protein|tara:strand:- start:1226 stop:1372 length:147 start_codon:yes stop_codon:yes gene_type:complete
MKQINKERQYRSNQGRSPEKMEKVYKGCFWIIIIGILSLGVVSIYNII